MSVNFFGYFSLDIVYIVIALATLTLISIIVAVVAMVKTAGMRKKYNAFMQGENGESIEKLVKGNLDSIREIKTLSSENAKAVKDIYNKLQYTFHKVGIVKYDAFHEMGGKLSFSLCMLDRRDCGYIINVMHSNTGCYAYIKEIVNGKSYIELGTEEEKALNQALAGKTGDEELSKKVNDMLEQEEE